MALLPPIVVSLYPNVPFLPGVPQLIRSPLFPPSPAPVAGTSATQGQLADSANQTAIWGICDSDLTPVVTPDSILAFGQRSEARISNFPVQAGGFANYNKVFLPFELSVGMSKGSALEDRQDFLNDIESVYRSFDLYTILTPERSYQNCNVHRYEVVRHDEKAAFFLTDVEVFFTQIVEVSAQYTTAAADTTNAQAPASMPPVKRGAVQPQVPGLFNTPGQKPFILETNSNDLSGLSPPNLNAFN